MRGGCGVEATYLRSEIILQLAGDYSSDVKSN